MGVSNYFELRTLIIIIMAQQQEGGKTSFNSYTFTYNWRIDDLETKFLSSRFSTFSSGSFSSPTGVRPSMSWMLTVFTDEDTDILEDIPPSSPAGEQSLSATLKRLPYQPTPVNSGRSTATVNYLGSAPGLQLGVVPRGLHLGQHGSTTPSDDSKAVWVEAILKLKSSNFNHLTEFEPSHRGQQSYQLTAEPV